MFRSLQRHSRSSCCSSHCRSGRNPHTPCPPHTEAHKHWCLCYRNLRHCSHCRSSSHRGANCRHRLEWDRHSSDHCRDIPGNTRHWSRSLRHRRSSCRTAHCRFGPSRHRMDDHRRPGVHTRVLRDYTRSYLDSLRCSPVLHSRGHSPLRCSSSSGQCRGRKPSCRTDRRTYHTPRCPRSRRRGRSCRLDECSGSWRCYHRCQHSLGERREIVSQIRCKVSPPLHCPSRQKEQDSGS